MSGVARARMGRGSPAPGGGVNLFHGSKVFGLNTNRFDYFIYSNNN